MKLLSLFDGSGAFGLAAQRHGITARYASEVEPFPISVTRAKFPQMEHLGDVTKISGGAIEPCDIVSFGSPCTDISIAGKCEGLTAVRSGLFFEAVRIIREMLETTGGNFPRYFIFENVPNLVSIHGGADWRMVMDEFACLGFICDPNILDAQEFGVAQRRKRIFIAGINRKHYNPADFADVPNVRDKRMQKAIDNWCGETFHGITSRPHEINRQHLSEILERDVDEKYYLTRAACLGILRRVDAKGKQIPQLLRSALEHQAGLFNCGENGEPVTFEPGATARLPKGKYWSGIAPTLRADMGDNQVAAAIPIDVRNATRNGGNQGVGIGDSGQPSYTITAEYAGAVAVESHPNDSRVKIDERGTFQTLTSRLGSGGNNTPLVAEPVAYGICAEHANSMNSANPYSGVYETDTAKTLTTGTQTPNNQGGLVIAVQGSVVGRKPENGPAGKGFQEDVAFTVNTVDKGGAVCYQDVAPTLTSELAHQNGNGIMTGGGAIVEEVKTYAMTTGSFANVAEDISQTLMARQYKDAPIVNRHAYGLDRASYNMSDKATYKPQIDEEFTHSLTAQGPNAVSAPPTYVVRRLTPSECLVLMGLPRDWCEDIAVTEPTEEDYIFWEDVFATLGKKKSRKQIAAWLRKPYSDGACYKMAGNGLVVAVAEFVLSGIVEVENE
ncbi:hypothetical protein FACS1894105_10460 [Clostridia bacterium]|nr:hypothetical protein FACS1894105_10460 [Clostridia bacterium]